MKEEIYKICTQLNDGQIAVVEAQEQLLLLFSVSCQRELFIAMIDKMKESDWQEADNGFAGRVFDRLNSNNSN